MIVWLRLLIAFVGSFFRKPIRDPQEVLSGELNLSFRVWLTVCEGSLLNNARYFTFVEACRLDTMRRTGHFKYLLKQKTQVVVASQYIRYIKAIKRFQNTQLIYWDEKYFYFKHIFRRTEKEMAIVYAKVVGIKKRMTVKPQEILEGVGFQMNTPPLPPLIQKWSKFEETLKEP